MDIRHGIVAAMLMLGPAAAMADCTARSPDHSVALLELYTSEGCDSCPPADRWLSRFNQASGTNRVVPLALHVDYWDRLGWKDRFATAEYTERWWELRGAYGGVMPPIARRPTDFDPGAKYHVAGNVPYMRYFLAQVLEFQFYRSLCRAASVTIKIQNRGIPSSDQAQPSQHPICKQRIVSPIPIDLRPRDAATLLVAIDTHA